MVRGTVALPHGTGKSVRVACFCREDLQAKAKEAGADVVGADDLVEKVRKGEINFDVAVAAPNMMKEVGTLGKVLGPRGLMPNPKVGTVTPDVAKAIRELKGGRIEFKLDKQADIHVAVGKISFSEKALSENVQLLYHTLLKAKPSSVKGTYIQRATLSSTMGPGIRLDLTEFKGEE
jgi:large subunit ribosomal protein L1